MSDWYYATAGGQRHGPLPAVELRRLAEAGEVGPQALVWREGMAQWRPLQEFAIELGLPALPPPLPASAPVASAPPRSGLSGCVIALLVVVAGVFVVGLLGILAAIALPAYQDYTLRSQAAAAIAQARALQAPVGEFLATHGRCPTNDDPGFDDPAGHAQGPLSAVTFGEFDGSDLCGLEATIAAPGRSALDGRLIWLEYDPDGDGWRCSSDAEDRHLPVSCRG